MIEQLATLLGRNVRVRGTERLLRAVYPFRLDSPRFVQGVRARADGLRMQLDSRELIDWHILFRGEYEPHLRKVFELALPHGGVAVDVGANVGAHTLTLARIAGPAGRVFAFEPNPPIREKLARNVALNGFSCVDVRGCALGSGESSMSLRVPALTSLEGCNPGLASLVYLETPHESVRVDVRRFDAVSEEQHLDRVDLVKIDVQGYECFALEGMQRTLEKFRPTVIFEYHRDAWDAAGKTFRDAVNIFDPARYAFFGVDVAAELRLAAIDPASDPDACVDVLALPLEKRDAMLKHAQPVSAG